LKVNSIFRLFFFLFVDIFTDVYNIILFICLRVHSWNEFESIAFLSVHANRSVNILLYFVMCCRLRFGGTTQTPENGFNWIGSSKHHEDKQCEIGNAYKRVSGRNLKFANFQYNTFREIYSVPDRPPSGRKSVV